MLAAAVLFMLLPSTIAEANSRVCRQLEAQLVATSSSGASSNHARRYDAAIKRQQEQIRKARSQAQQAGCGRSIIGSAVAFCAGVSASLGRMEKNLSELQRTRRSMGGGGDNRRERARIQAALDANDCRTPTRTLTPGQNEARNQSSEHPRSPRGSRGQQLSGNFRTMCVRTCDGYYFPISWSVSQAAFGRDQSVCAAMCPGVEVELYYHRVPGEESEAMVSASTGLPYTDMPNAFRYRQPNASVPAGCGCEAAIPGTIATRAGPERQFTIIGGEYGKPSIPDAPGEPQDIASIPLPSGKPDIADDPETLANREGGLDLDALRKLATPKRRPPVDENGERVIRVVGPTFLPGPEEAIDLQAPVPDRGP